MKRFTLLLALLAWVGVADADTAPPTQTVIDSNCMEITFCEANTGTGDCTAGSPADEVVRDMTEFSRISFYSGESVGAHTCDLYTNSNGHDAASGTGHKFNSTSLTASTPVLTYPETTFAHVWVSCPTVGTSVTVKARACRR